MAEMFAYAGHEAAQVERLVQETGQQPAALSAFLSGGVGPDWQFSSENLGGTGTEIGLWSIPLVEDDAGVDALRDAAAGGRNGDYTAWAESIAANSGREDGEPIYIRPDWEIGGEWFPWTARAQEDPDAYKEAFGQMSTSFKAVDGDFKFVWDATADRGDPTGLYPGNDVVDVISGDHYLQRDWQGDDPVAAFAKTKDGYAYGLSQMDAFAEANGKQIAISEMGASGADAGEWFDQVQEWAAGQDNLAYVNVWYADADSGYHGNDNPEAVGEFMAEGIGGGEGVSGADDADSGDKVLARSETEMGADDDEALGRSETESGTDGDEELARSDVDSGTEGDELFVRSEDAPADGDELFVRSETESGANGDELFVRSEDASADESYDVARGSDEVLTGGDLTGDAGSSFGDSMNASHGCEHSLIA